MTRVFLLVCGLLLCACGSSHTAATQPSTQDGLHDAEALQKLDAELAKPLPEFWKETSMGFILDPVAMCNKPDIDKQVKNEAAAQLEKAKTAMQDASITVQESMENAAVVFSIRVLANCAGRGEPLVTGDVSAMPGNGAVAAKSDLFEISHFDAGKVTLALLRHEALIKRMQASDSRR